MITELKANKIHYLPGEEATFTVTVHNNSGEKTDVAIDCYLVRRLTDRTDVGRQTVTLDAGETRNLIFTHKLGEQEYGCEVCAEIEDTGDASSPQRERMVRREFFGVSRNVGKIGLLGDGRYANYMDIFAWAPDDFGNMAPEREEWWAGQVGWKRTKTRMRKTIGDAHERGVKVLTYGKGVPGGIDGMQLLIDHPDWACYNRYGQLGGLDASFDVWSIEHWNDEDRNWSFWNCWTVNFEDPNAVIYGSQALLDSAEMFGFDGVRFDGGFELRGGYGIDGKPIPTGDERLAVNTRNVQIMKEFFAERRPQYLFGYNSGVPSAVPTAFDKEVCRGGGMLMDEGMRNMSDPQHPLNAWKSYLRYVLDESVGVNALGGYLLSFAMNVRGVDVDYALAFCLAARSRPYGWGFTQATYPQDAFATRYSEFMMNNDIATLDEPESIFSVTPENLWWKDWAAVYEPERKTKFYILHLFNPPPAKGIGNTPTPDPVENIAVTAVLPAGEHLKQANLISAEPDVNSIPLDAVENDGKLAFSIDRVHIWRILVLEVEADR